MIRAALFAALLACLPGLAGAQTLRIGLREDPDILDPTLARTYVGRIVFAGLCDKLFDIDAGLKIVPMLATGYEWADPVTLVIHLRGDVSFQDGTKLDADAVKYSLMRHLTMQGSFRRSEINTIDHVDVVDPDTVRIVLKSPSSPFLSQLTDRAGMIVSPKAAEASGKDFGLHPVCAGPFAFTERVANDHITAERFPGYWNAAAIHFDKVTWQTIVDPSVRVANLRAGALDLVESIVPSDVDQVKADKNLRIMTTDALGYQGITVNGANGPRANTPFGRDVRVRQAFELSLDRDAIIQVVYNGMFTPTVQAVPPLSPFYAPAIKPPARDVERAKALLKEAGVATPVKVEMLTANNGDIRQMGEVIQSMAAEAGFDVHLTNVEFASSLDQATRGDFELHLEAWSGRPDADGNLYTFLHTGGAANDGHYSNADVDSLLDQARAVSDVAQRRDLYTKMWTTLRRDLPIIYLYTPRVIEGMSAKLAGFTPVPDGLIRLTGVSLQK